MELNKTLAASIITFVTEFEQDKKEVIFAIRQAMSILKDIGYNKDGTPKDNIEQLCLEQLCLEQLCPEQLCPEQPPITLVKLPSPADYGLDSDSDGLD